MMICASLITMCAQEMILGDALEIKFPMTKIVPVMSMMTLFLNHSSVLWTSCFLIAFIVCDVISLRTQTQSLDLEFSAIIRLYLFQELTQLAFKIGLYIFGLTTVRRIQIEAIQTVLSPPEAQSRPERVEDKFDKKDDRTPTPSFRPTQNQDQDFEINQGSCSIQGVPRFKEIQQNKLPLAIKTSENHPDSLFRKASKSQLIFHFGLQTNNLEVLMISDPFFAELPHMEKEEISTALALENGVSVLSSRGWNLMKKPILEPYPISNRTKIFFKDDIKKPQSLMAIIRQYKHENSADLCLYFKSARVGIAQGSCCEINKTKALRKIKRVASEYEYRKDEPEKCCDCIEMVDWSSIQYFEFNFSKIKTPNNIEAILLDIKNITAAIQNQQKKSDELYQDAIEANFSHEQMNPLNNILQNASTVHAIISRQMTELPESKDVMNSMKLVKAIG